jgi:hypothetical protein
MLLILILCGCSVGAGANGGEDLNLQRYARLEVYSASDDRLISIFEDEDTLIQFNKNIDFSFNFDQQDRNKGYLEEQSPQFIIKSYKKSAAILSNDALEEDIEITIYIDTNMIKMQTPSDTVKNHSVQSNFLTSYHEISNEAIIFLTLLSVRELQDELDKNKGQPQFGSSESNRNEQDTLSESNHESAVVIDISNNGQKNISQSSSFRAEANQDLTLEIKSSIIGGTVDFFLFSPSNEMDSLTIDETGITLSGKIPDSIHINGTNGTLSIALSEGTWAYNCTGFFESGIITVTGTIR